MTPASARTSMTAQTGRKTFVLVHGSSAGGWCYRQVADLLEARGHKVYAPTLTGLGERVPKKTYVRATGYDSPNFDRFYAKVKADPSWRSCEMACGHEMMIDMPERTAEILIEAA